MTQIRVVRYTTTSSSRDANAELVSAVYSALAEAQPDGLRYATLQVGEEPSFLHIAALDGDHNPLPTLPAFQEFQRDLATRVVAPPDAQPATLIGSYRLL
jgi:hypothetical protein